MRANKEALKLFLEILAGAGALAEYKAPLRWMRFETHATDADVKVWPLRTKTDVLSLVNALTSASDWKYPKCLKNVHIGGWVVRKTLQSASDARTPMPDDIKVGNELAFDVDMNDYASVRNQICACGDKAKICGTCQWLIHAACAIIVFELKERFAYKHVLCCFSGRRGLHIHVLDPEATVLEPDARRALAESMTCPISTKNETRGKYTYRTDLIAQDLKRVSLCMPFFIRTYVRAVGVTASRKRFTQFFKETVIGVLSKDVEVTMFHKTVDAAMEDFTAAIKPIPKLAGWPAAGDAIWLAFRQHGLNCELMCQHDPLKAGTWYRLRNTFERWLLMQFMPRLDMKLYSHLGHNIRMPWSFHFNAKRPVLPYDHRLDVDNLLPLAEWPSKRSMDEALHVTRRLHTELDVTAHFASLFPPSPPAASALSEDLKTTDLSF
jgi:hypothetical protein